MRRRTVQTLGTSVYDAYMVVDDDDGNLANGTPNAAYINQAFEHHGMPSCRWSPIPPTASLRPTRR